MIIEGGSYANGGWWAKHAQSVEKNERAALMEAEGFSGTTIDEFFREMKAVSLGTKCTNYFYQYNIDLRPGETLTDAQWEDAHAITRKNHGMENHAWFRVRHVKNGQTHEHGFICRIDPERMRAHSDSLSAQIREQTSRELEQKYGLTPVKSVLVPDRDSPRPERRPKKWEQFRGAQAELDPKDIARELQTIKQRSDNGQSFKAGIEAAGYILARGDKRDFVIVDQRGDDHSLARRLHIKTAELREFMKDVDPATLPSVDQARSRQNMRGTGEARQRYEALAPVKPLEQTDTLSDGHGGEPARPLNRTQGDIRLAFTLSRSPEELQQAVAGRHISFARVSADEAKASRSHAKLYREQRQGLQRWKAINRYAAMQPEPPQPLRYAPTLKEGEIVAVDGRGQVYRLDRRTTAFDRGEIDKRLGGIDAGSLRNITDAKAAMIEARRVTQETERAQRRIDAPLGKTAGDIRTAWTLSRSQEQLHAALAGRDLGIARVTAAEASESERKTADAKAAGTYAPLLKEGELVAVNGFGNVYRFDEHTTGQFRSEIDKRLAGIDAGSLLSVADTTAKVRETSKAAWLAQQRDERDRQRPANAIENKIIECAEQGRLHGATVRQNRQGEIVSGVDALADRLRPADERQTHSAMVQGDQAIAARLEQAGIAIVRVTADDVKALDALRSEEELARATAKDVQGRKPRIFAKVEAGDLAAVTRAGNVFRLNPHRLDLAGLESAISSTVPQSKRSSSGLPSVTETRARFESEGQKKTALWDQRRVASAERRASREQSFSQQQTMRRAATAAIGKPGETVNRSIKPAGKALGIIGGIAAKLGKIADMLFPAKPPSPEQQKRNYWAAKEQQATDEIAAKKETAAEQERQQRNNARQTYFPSLTRPINRDPERDYDRGRERDR
jgi:hypothetical protein